MTCKLQMFYLLQNHKVDSVDFEFLLWSFEDIKLTQSWAKLRAAGGPQPCATYHMLQRPGAATKACCAAALKPEAPAIFVPGQWSMDSHIWLLQNNLCASTANSQHYNQHNSLAMASLYWCNIRVQRFASEQHCIYFQM